MTVFAHVVAPLPAPDTTVQIVPMLTPSQAVDLFLGDFARKSRSKNGKSTKDYRRLLDKFTDSLPADLDVTDITSDHCRRFLDMFVRLSPGTQATNYSILNSFLEWLDRQERIRRNPLDHVTQPRRIPSEDLDVVTVSTQDVGRLFLACDPNRPAERIALSILAYLGPRRSAVAALRFRDYDRAQGRLRFYEKGSKAIWKPIPHELRAVLEAALAAGVYGSGQHETTVIDGQPVTWEKQDPNAYLVPSEGPLVRKGDRDDRVIWRIVKKVADRAGVDAHVHSLRAAFATFYLEQPENRRDLVGLQELMGHRNIETTRIYLRKLDKQQAMEPVRSLSWAAVTGDNAAASFPPQTAGISLGSSLVMGAGGFEPPKEENPHEQRAHSEQTGNDLEETLIEVARTEAKVPVKQEVSF